jgi:hypothetical protein
MNNYSSPEVVEVGNASEVVRGLKDDDRVDNDGSGIKPYPAASVLDVD